MKEGWKYRKLEEVCNFISGYTPKTYELTKDGDIPYFKVSDMNRAENALYMIDTDLYYNGAKKKIPAGSIIFPKNGGAIFTGKKRILSTNSIVDLNTEAIKVINNELNELYVYKFILSLDLGKFDNGGGLPSLNIKKLKEQIIPIPTQKDQLAIVTRLDNQFAKLDQLKANAEKQYTEAKELYQKALEECLSPTEGWIEKSIQDIISHLRTGLNPRIHFKLNTIDAEGYYITVRELKGFTIEPDAKTDKINDAAIKRINERSKLKIGDVLFSGTGTIGKTALVSEHPNTWNIKEGVYAMTPKHDILDSKWFIYYLSSDFFVNKVKDKATGAGVQSIPMKELVKFKLDLPSLEIQQQIVDKLDQISEKVHKLEENLKTIANYCDDMKQQILKETFE